MNRVLLFYFLGATGLTACSTFNRTEHSGYAYTNADAPSTVENFYQERFAKRYKDSAEELGIDPYREHNELEVQRIRSRITLNNLERKISSNTEKKQYYDLKPNLTSDEERIYFLRLTDPASRTRWTATRGIASLDTKIDTVTQTIVDNNDIMQGMTKTAVQQSWGEPDAAEVAGNSLYGNERWVYKKLVPSEDGYKHETRFVYFETGRVVGWETVDGK